MVLNTSSVSVFLNNFVTNCICFPVYVNVAYFSSLFSPFFFQCRQEGEGGSRCKLPGPGSADGVSGPDYGTNVSVFLGSKSFVHLNLTVSN
jgi:hypothetical protein